jgi:deazaflavin-dependent oxidoreductase (nitroreductase family)
MGIAPESWPGPFQMLIRNSNKYLLNPLMLRLAGRRWWYASVVEHTGRTSGKRYSTPVVADRVGEHLMIPLPYGTQVDWVRNVLSSGAADVVSKGRTYHVVSPELIDSTQALPELPRDRRRAFERVNIEHFLRMDIATNG